MTYWKMLIASILFASAETYEGEIVIEGGAE